MEALKTTSKNMKTGNNLHKNTTWQCNICAKEFKYESEMKRHAQSHVPQFECKVCSKKFSFMSALRRHEKQHDRTGMVQCNKCDSHFRDETLLLRHLQYAHKETSPCPKCDAVFHSEIALKSHLKKHRPDSERRYRCCFDGCGKAFNFSQHLKHHELTHTEVKLHYCNICEKGFIQLHHWKAHIKSHDPDSWLSCTVPNCSKKFINQYTRKRHIATHRNKQPNNGVFSDSLAVPDSTLLTLYEKYVNEYKQPNGSTCNELITSNTKKGRTAEKKSSFKSQPRVNHVIDVKNGKIVVNGCTNGKIFKQEPNSQTQHAKTKSHKCTKTKKKNKVAKKNVRSSDSSNIRDEQSDKVDGTNTCKSCDCSKLRPSCSNVQNVNNKPLLEYRLDGTVKLKELFDVDIVVATGSKHDCKSVTDQQVKDKLENLNIKREPYNFTTCKDILGNCIVTGNGSTGEGCLCAKMSMDNQEVTAQEIDEITPNSDNCDVWLV